MNQSENGKSEEVTISLPLHLRRNLIGFTVLVLDFSLAFVGWIMWMGMEVNRVKEYLSRKYRIPNQEEDLNHKDE